MKKYIQTWRTSMLLESGNPLLLNEGLFDLGLPAEIAESINKDFEGVPEKGKTIIGKLVKETPINGLTNEFSRPLKNDLYEILKQIKIFTMDMATDDDGRYYDDIPKDDRKKINQFVENLDLVASGGNPDETIRWWDTKIADVQKLLKMTKREFTKGTTSKLVGKAIAEQYLEIIEKLVSDLYEDFARHIGTITLEVQVWLKSQKDEYRKSD